MTTTPAILWINFSHPLTPQQIGEAAALLGVEAAEIAVRDITVQLDLAAPLMPQIDRLLAAAPVTPLEWQTGRVVVALPGHGAAAAGLLPHFMGWPATSQPRFGWLPSQTPRRRATPWLSCSTFSKPETLPVSAGAGRADDMKKALLCDEIKRDGAFLPLLGKPDWRHRAMGRIRGAGTCGFVSMPS